MYRRISLAAFIAVILAVIIDLIASSLPRLLKQQQQMLGKQNS
jgi:hypothetical protein